MRFFNLIVSKIISWAYILVRTKPNPLSFLHNIDQNQKSKLKGRQNEQYSKVTFLECVWWMPNRGIYGSAGMQKNCHKIKVFIEKKQLPFERLKGALSDLRHFLTTESPLKMKNAFYFTSKALFILKIFKFLSWLFGHVAKRLDKKDKVNFKFYDVTVWLTNNCKTHIVQCLEKQRQSGNEIWSINRM